MDGYHTGSDESLTLIASMGYMTVCSYIFFSSVQAPPYMDDSRALTDMPAKAPARRLAVREKLGGNAS